MPLADNPLWNSGLRSGLLSSTPDYLRMMGYQPTIDSGLEPDTSTATVRRYFMGDQVNAADLPEHMADEIAGILVSPTGKRFSVNVLRRIVDSLVAMLDVTGVNCPARNESGDEAQQWLWDRWRASTMGREVDRLFTAACVDGRAYLIVDFGRDGQPVASVNVLYETLCDQGVQPVELDETGRVTSAIKTYYEARVVDATRPGVLLRLADWILGRRRDAVKVEQWRWRIVYEQDRIRRFVTPPGGNEEPAREDRDGLPPETAWPYGCPVIEFASPSNGEVEDLLNLQRLLNEAFLAVCNVQRVQGFPIMATIDVTDLDEEITVGPGSIVPFTSKNIGAGEQGRVEVFKAADLNSSLQWLRMIADFMCWCSETPTVTLPWTVGSEWPSGTALELSFRPLLDKARRYQEFWSPQFEAMFGMWQAMAGREVVQASPVWKAPDLVGLLERLQAAQMAVSSGLPPEVAWAITLNMEPDELIDTVRKSKELAGSVPASGEQKPEQPAETGV